MTEPSKGGIVGVRCVRGNISMEEHLRCQREELGPPCGIAPTVLNGMLRPKNDRAGVVFSPSSIQSCQRQYALKQDHEWYVDVEGAWMLYRGDLFHAGLKEEPAPPGTLGVVRELRMHSPIETSRGVQVFSGQADETTLLSIEHVTHLVEPDEHILHVKIVDWKSKNDIPHSMLEADWKHVYQINEYRWLAEKVLLAYLKGWKENVPDHLDARLYMGTPEDIQRLTGAETVDFSTITSIVVDEIAIVYLSSSKTRTFSSETFLYARGKMLGESTLGADGKMHFHAFRPRQYEDIELAPLRKWQLEQTEQIIREGIERQIEGEEHLAPPLAEDDAQLMCERCPVRQACYDIGMAQGYDMKWQRPYVEHT